MKLLICGKGGCGKSTVAALLAKAMQRRGRRVFLVDADESNIGLYRMLGMEHFGRSLDGLCDHLLCVVDPSFESIMMAKRVKAFAGEANLAVSFVLNRLIPEAENELSQALDSVGIIGRLPDSRSIFLNNLKGIPLDLQLPEMESVCDALEKAVTAGRVAALVFP